VEITPHSCGHLGLTFGLIHLYERKQAMNLNLTEEQIAVRDAARDFAQNVLKPGVIERDRDQRFPADEVRQLGELGFMGMMVDPKYGGSGMDTVSYVLAMEEISKVDASTSVCMSVNNSLVCYGLQAYGTEAQKEKYLRPLARAKKSAHFAFPNLRLDPTQRPNGPPPWTWETTTF
jgi:alkylation response protein AidB-like acyl-CoA dehydrogenase